MKLLTGIVRMKAYVYQRLCTRLSVWELSLVISSLLTVSFLLKKAQVSTKLHKAENKEGWARMTQVGWNAGC